MPTAPRPEGVLHLKSKTLFSRKHRRFVAIDASCLSTFRCDENDIAVLKTRKDLPFSYVESMKLDGDHIVVKRRKPWRHAVVLFCESDAAARLWADALQTRLDAFLARARARLVRPDELRCPPPPRPPSRRSASLPPAAPPEHSRIT